VHVHQHIDRHEKNCGEWWMAFLDVVAVGDEHGGNPSTEFMLADGQSTDHGTCENPTGMCGRFSSKPGHYLTTIAQILERGMKFGRRVQSHLAFFRFASENRCDPSLS
jgi:hypothetical protein